MGRFTLYIYSGFFLFLLILFLYILVPFFRPIVWGIVASIVFYPLYEIFKKKIKNGNLASFFVVSIVFFLMIIPLSIIIILTTQQFILFSVKVLNFFQTHSIDYYINSIKENPYIKENWDKFAPLINYLQSEEFRNALIGTVNKVLTYIGNQLRSYVYAVGTGIFHVFVFMLTLFFLLRDGEKIFNEIKKLTPLKEEDKEEVFKTIYITLLSVIYGTVGTAIAQSIVSFIGYSLAGIKFSLLWSILTFFAAFIPPFGAAFVWVPLDIYTFATKGIKEGIILLIWGTLFISTMDNIVRPLVMKKGIKLPYVALFFATIGGLIQFGFVGIFIGPIILSTLLSAIKLYEKRVISNT